jgi:hypothetical protein
MSFAVAARTARQNRAFYQEIGRAVMHDITEPLHANGYPCPCLGSFDLGMPGQPVQAAWTRGLDLGVDVFPDIGFWSRAERDTIRSVVAYYGGEPVLYHLNCAEETAWKRVDERIAL